MLARPRNACGCTSTIPSLIRSRVGGQPLGERRRAAIDEPVLIAMPGTGDAAVDDAAFADRAILMGARLLSAPISAPSRNTRCASPPGADTMRALLSGMEDGAPTADPAVAASGFRGRVRATPSGVQHRNEAKAAEQHRWNERRVHVLHDPERDVHHDEAVGDIKAPCAAPSRPAGEERKPES